jgi:hypothetical protein
MKFSELQAGKKAEKSVVFPHPFISEETVEVLVIPLTGHEEAEALTFAQRFATERQAKASPGEPIFDLGLMVATLLRGTLDPATHERFFGSESEALRLPREGIMYLFEHQQTWQDSLSPSVKNLGHGEIVAKIVELSEAEDPAGFIRLSPGLRWICTRTMARLLVSSLTDKSLLGSGFEPDTKPTADGKPLRSEAP